MALTDGELTIGNQALLLIGQKIIDSSDTSTADTGTGGSPYEKLELIFDQTRDTLLRLFEWPFARERLALVGDWATSTAYTTDQYVWEDEVLYKCNTAHTSTTWNTDYVMDGDEYVMDDDDYVRDDSVTFYWDMITDRPETLWSYRYALPSDFKRFRNDWLRENEKLYTLEGNYILTNLDELDIEYIRQVTDTSQFDSLFTEVFIYDLAIKLTFPLMGLGYPAQAVRKGLNDERKKWIIKARQVCIAEINQSGGYNWHTARNQSTTV